MSLCSSLHRPKLCGKNRLPCMAMSLISPKLLRHMSSCSRRSSQGIAFKTIILVFVDFSLNWSCITHILDMTHTLLVEMGVPHFLWSDALLTCTYLLNRLPSSPLGDEVPFIISTLIVSSLPCLFTCLVVWASFMITLLIYSIWHPIL